MITSKSNHFLISGLMSLSQAGSLPQAEEDRSSRGGMDSLSDCPGLKSLLDLTSQICDPHPPMYTLCKFSWILSPGPEWRQEQGGSPRFVRAS